jgi:hypothetical protein
MTNSSHSNLRVWFSEIGISIALFASVGISLIAFHQGEQDSLTAQLIATELPQMRGEETRQIIRMGVPDTWIEQLEILLYELDVEIVVSRYEDFWFIDIPIEQPLNRRIQVVFERFGINFDKNNEIKIALTGV